MLVYVCVLFVVSFQWEKHRRIVKGEPLLHAGARGGCNDVVALLVAKGCDVNQKDELVRTLEIISPRYTHMYHLTPVLGDTLAGGGFVVQNDLTALLKAASNGHTSIANALVAAGADVNAIDKVSTSYFLVMRS